MATTSHGIPVERLRAELDGGVIAPGDADYDAARAVFSAAVDRRPAVIVRPADAAEVAYVVSLARETGLELAVRGGGHSVAGHGVSEGGIVLDLSRLKALEIDPVERVAWAETGLNAGELTTCAGAHGLAVGFGDTGSVGIGGLTLGGGVGYLVRKHGLTIDSLLGAEIVTADGELLEVDADRHPDLFWAIRGGGGNFGVATRLRYRLEPVDAVVGGMLILPASPEVVAGFVAAADAAPDELSTIANVMPAPPLPFVPEEHHGRLVVLAMLVHAGPAEDAERVLAPFRALAPPVADLLRPMRYPELYGQAEGGGGLRTVARSLFVDAVDAAVAGSILDRLRASSAQMSVAQIRVLGGAAARVPNEATAYAHRQRRIMVNVAARYAGPGEAAVHEAWASETAAALRRGEDRVYVNFLGDEGPERVRAAYPGSTWERLREVKRRYDPDNLFRLNHNIPPADGA
ncbi:MAG: FAD-binding oxidoreductase [Gaiellaceae bacterium]